MSNNILFSIIIPTYNRADFNEKTIHSLLEQTYQNFEIIVVDDGSTDNTEEVVKSIKDNRIFYYKKINEERGVARNYGAERAKGDYFNFFDSDDLAYNNHLQEALHIILKNNKPEILALGYDIKNTKGETSFPTIKYTNINKQLIKGNLLSCNSVFIRNDIFNESRFNIQYRLSFSEDYLLWIKLASVYTFFYSNKKTSALITHEGRSVNYIDKNKLISQKELVLDILLNEASVQNFYKNTIHYLKENTYSYIALHLVLAKYKKDGIKYYIKAIKARPTFLFSRRSLAIIKHLIF